MNFLSSKNIGGNVVNAKRVSDYAKALDNLLKMIVKVPILFASM